MSEPGKATARAHPIQGLVKYHGMRDPDLRLPYHDSISVCTAPAASTTTVAFGVTDADEFVIDGETVTGRARERVIHVVDHVRERAGVDAPVRFVSESTFPTNIGFGSSSSGFAAAATALCAAAGLDLSRPALSTVARRGSSSAARAVTGGFSQLDAGMDDADCRSHRIASSLDDELRIVACEVPAYKETEDAHREAADSHMFEARLAHIHEQTTGMRAELRNGEFDAAFERAERDSLSLAATTMTGPAGWVYWQPTTLEVFEAVRDLREEGVPAYFSTDTGASVYVNTTRDAVDRVQERLSELAPTRIWEVGGPARVLDPGEALF